MAAEDPSPQGRDKTSNAPSKSLYALSTHLSGRFNGLAPMLRQSDWHLYGAGYQYTTSHENGGTFQRVNPQETFLRCIPKRTIDSGGEAIEQRLGI